MSDPSKKPLDKQSSLSYIEQSLKMISPPQQAPVTIYPGPKASLQNLSKADLEIADRLEKLRRRSRDEVPTEEEMAERLALLKGLPYDHYTKVTIIPKPNTRTHVEQADDLIKQIYEEVSLESRIAKPEHEIEERLSRLKGSSHPTNLPSTSSDDQSTLSSLSTDANEIDLKEFEFDAKNSENAANSALESLLEDKEIAQTIQKTKKKGRQKQIPSLDEEMCSGSDLEEVSGCPESGETLKEKEEVDRLIQMYTDKAKLKKKKKKVVEGAQLPGEVISSDSELSSSDSDILTSESEKISIDDD